MSKPHTIELSWLDRFKHNGGWGFRIDGDSWIACESLAGATPKSDHIEDMQNAIVAIAHAYDLTIEPDDIWIGGLHAGWYDCNED